MAGAGLSLSDLFAAVAERMRQEREVFNQADTYNGDHGDHMVAIFEIASQAAQDASLLKSSAQPTSELATVMQSAAENLRSLQENNSAQLYAIGLESFARQFARNEVSLEELDRYVRSVLREGSRKPDSQDAAGALSSSSLTSSGKVLRALVAGINGWQAASGPQEGAGGSDMNLQRMFDLGMIYYEAKRRGGTKAQVLAEAAVEASPLKDVSYRAESGKLALRTLLEELRK
jgi:hypothetical protein